MEKYRQGLYGQGSSRRWRNSEEFQEADVWGAIRPIPNSRDLKSEGCLSVCKRLPTAAARMIPKSADSSCKNNSLAEGQQERSSAPVNIPADWSKINRTKKPSYESDEEENGFGQSSWESEDDEEGDENHVIPPHEWIARKISSFSVCEGAGRTLKGRDLSRVRNQVLTKTGFLE